MEQPSATSRQDSDAARLYLDLLKKALSFSLWREPGFPIDLYKRRTPLIVRAVATTVSRMLRLLRLQLVRIRSYDGEDVAEGSKTPLLADTMVGLKRLENIQLCVESVLRDDVPGDLIETGVWRGGASIFTRGVLAAHGVRDRRVFVADSFEGLPRPDAAKFRQDEGDEHYLKPYLSVSQQQVEANFRRYGLLDEQVVFLKGWFKDTLPSLAVDTFSVIRLDGDMYESTMDGLVNLYAKLAPGGYCIIDDYGLKGCRQAVDDFRASEGITIPLQHVDWTGVFWRKEFTQSARQTPRRLS